jgi:ABC-2 type transport system ATP-binding protein
VTQLATAADVSTADPTYDLAVVTHGLTKRYRSQTAVDNVDLVVPRGAVYGFLGPNGSGKTTTIRVLLGLAAATAGEVHLLGRPMPSSGRLVLPRVGALVEGPALYPFLSGRANLRRLDAADRLAPSRTRERRITEAIDRVGLSNAGDKRVRAYSLGMKQRLGLAAALLQPRELLVLDEPTNGLDPQGTREVRHLIRDLAADGTTVFVSSHLLAEVEQICTHLGVMSAGRLVAQGTMAELNATGTTRLVVTTPDDALALTTLTGLGLVDLTRGQDDDDPDRARRPEGSVTGVLPAAATIEVEDVAVALVRAGVRLRGLQLETDTLEDRFVALTGEGFEVVR